MNEISGRIVNVLTLHEKEVTEAHIVNSVSGSRGRNGYRQVSTTNCKF